MSRSPRIGLALGAGGARGWCHIGVIRALAERGIVPDVIVGASMGALVGGAHAAGRLDALEDWARAQTPRKLLTRLDVRATGGGLVGGAGIVAVLRDLGLERDIAELETPFAAVATDMGTGREVWMRSGGLVEAIRASISLPGVVAPGLWEGRWMLDGGLVNPIPVTLAHALGAEVVIAVNPNARPDGVLWREPEADPAPSVLSAMPGPVRKVLEGLTEREEGPQPPDYLDVVNTSIDIMTDRIRRSRLAGDPPSVMLSGDLSAHSVLDFHAAGPIIGEGARMVEQAEAQLRPLME